MGQQLSDSQKMMLCTSTTCVQQNDMTNNQMNWKNYTMQECVDLQDYCIWAKKLMPLLTKLPSQPIYQYTKEIEDFDKNFRMQYQETVYQPNRSQAYRNSLNNLGQNLLPDNIDEEQKIGDEFQTIHKMIKKTCLNDDDIFLQISKNKNSFRQSLESYRSSSISPSYIHYEKGPLQQQSMFTIDELDQLRNQIQYYTKLTLLIQEQMKINTHQLFQIRDSCIESLVEYYNECNPQHLQNLVTEIQQFSRVYVRTFQIYYNLEVLCENKKYAALVNIDNLMNFSVYLLLETPKLNKVLYSTISKSEIENIEIIDKELKSKVDVTPELMEVPIKFRLDQSTVNLLNKKNETQYQYREHIPYQKVIKIMKGISKALSPTSKYKILMRLSESIMKCIQQFYQEYGSQFTDLVESDDIMSILTYILYKSGVSDITVHEIMIEKFSTNKLLTGTTGYYLIAIRAVVDEIIQKNQKKNQ